MGFMDKLGSLFGDSKPDITDSVKPAGQVLRENGIDTSNLKFKYNQDGSVEVSGTSASQEECDRICELVKEMPTTSEVHNKLTIGVPEPVPVPEAAPQPEVMAEPEPTPTPEPEAAQEEQKGRTYTVKSGDTLWKISEHVYGSGNKYMKIFEANTSMLDNPDKIFPGQELVIPDLDD